MKIKLYQDDIPKSLKLGNLIAIDTEAMGLNHQRDRLCLVQLSNGNGTCHLLKINNIAKKPKNLIELLKDKKILKIFHYARFDVGILNYTYNINIQNIYCTKIASKLVRTYTDKHGLKNLINELLELDISKQQQSSYWGSKELTKDQINYAASDVLYLHKIKTILDVRLKTEGRIEIADKCFNFLPSRAQLDILGWPDIDIFAH